MSDFLQSADPNTTGIEFLLADLELAFTFMDVARTSGDQAVMRRNYRKAHVAYDAVVRLLPKVKPTEAQQHAIDHKLSLLKARLEAVGERF